VASIYGGRLSPDGSAVFVEISRGTPDTGLWCDTCLLPSGIGVPVYALGDDGPRLLVYTRMCLDCGLPLTTTEDR
jgi:hypothetical protein